MVEKTELAIRPIMMDDFPLYKDCVVFHRRDSKKEWRVGILRKCPKCWDFEMRPGMKNAGDIRTVIHLLDEAVIWVQSLA